MNNTELRDQILTLDRLGWDGFTIAQHLHIPVAYVWEAVQDADREADPEIFEDTMSDIEADADTLASAGWGTNEDYGYFGGDEY